MEGAGGGDADQIIVDEAGRIVQDRFQTFLQDFHLRVIPSAPAADNASGSNDGEQHDAESELTTQQKHTFDYIAQIASMIQNNKTTLFVDFQHVVEADIELAEAIELEYFRFEPYLRLAVNEIIKTDNPYTNIGGGGAGGMGGIGNDTTTGSTARGIFVSFYRMPRVERIRAMRTDRLGRYVPVTCHTSHTFLCLYTCVVYSSICLCLCVLRTPTTMCWPV